MGLRSEGREAAVQYLFAHELHEPSGCESESEREGFWEIHIAKPKVREFAEELINGVLADIKGIDEQISMACTNFSIDRLANVDRNVIRVATYEIMHSTLSAPIIISEAIEIAKNFGAPDSARFVNGVVDRISRNVRKRAPQEERSPPRAVK
jgi:N utilization substance protein B